MIASLNNSQRTYGLPITVSAPRSGLNWLRFLTERYLELKTPGKKVLRARGENEHFAFMRSHDVLGLRKDPRPTPPSSSQWLLQEEFSPFANRVILLVRDPYSTFIRGYKRDFGLFRAHIGNLTFFAESNLPKVAFSYRDMIQSPVTAREALLFVAQGHEKPPSVPSVSELEDDWSELNRESREIYDKNNSRAGGAVTKDSPLDFGFWERKLEVEEKNTIDDLMRQVPEFLRNLA